MTASTTYDIAVIGAGPAGLHAALKAIILNHNVLLVDKGQRYARVCQAERIMNLPGHAAGMSGSDLLDSGRDQIRAFEKATGKQLCSILEHTEITDARREPDGTFLLRARPAREPDAREREYRARVLILATGIVDRKPSIWDFERKGHQTLWPAVHRGEVGYCVLCEGWDMEDKHVAVIGFDEAAVEIAADLSRHFGARVDLVTTACPVGADEGATAPGDAQLLQKLKDASVSVDARPVEAFHDAGGRLEIAFAGGARVRYDKGFLHLGWYRVQNALARKLGAKLDKSGYVVVDENSEVLGEDGRVIPGLFAVGDLRAGRWKQIPIAWGDAEMAVIHAYAHRLS